jgi:pimeloyl-ACP methyl ester carboxylesterase
LGKVQLIKFGRRAGSFCDAALGKLGTYGRSIVGPTGGIFLKALFIHGGPGFNSQPELKILGPALKKVGVTLSGFDEPSSFRPAQNDVSEPRAFQRVVTALTKTLSSQSFDLIFAHSWGIYPLIKALQDPKVSRPNKIVLISPILDLYEAHKYLAETAASDLDSIDTEKAAAIRKKLQMSQTFFDQELQEALQLGLAAPNLLSHFWCNANAAGAYFGSLTSPEYQVDIQNFFQILADFSLEENKYPSVFSDTTNYQVIIGEKDAYPERAFALGRLGELVPSFTTTIIQGANHYPHIEKPNEFIEAVLPAR